MSCGWSKEALALYLEEGLDEAGAATAVHVTRCGNCQRYLNELRDTQSLLKSLRCETVGRDECAVIRRQVMWRIREGRVRIGWMLGIERTIVLTVRRHAYALAACAVALAASVAMLAQIRAAAPDPPEAVALLGADDSLRLPPGYRDWMVVHRPTGPHVGGVVYVNPAGFSHYENTGEFPEGTVLIWASAETSERLASVRDSARFDGGWGFFDLTTRDGSVPTRAEPLPATSGCRTCHQRST